MKELSANSLKLRAQAHRKIINTSGVPILSSGNTVRAGQAVGGRHLVTLAPKGSNHSEELLDRAVTLVGGRKGLQQGVLKGLTGWLVEIR